MNIKRLTLLLGLFIGFALSFAEAQSCTGRYRSRHFGSIQIFRDVKYSLDAPMLLSASLGVETTYPEDLVMDIFLPPPTDPAQKRPVVILAHGGGFINVLFMGGTLLVGTKDNQDIQALADTLAHWGFVTASIQYRTGFDVLSGTSIKRAVWRGAQDMSAAVRFFRKNATWFNIDPQRIFIGGSSAGAFCAIHSTFVDNAERISESFQVTPVVMPDLGALHSRPVVQLTGFNPFTGGNVLGNDVDSIAQGVAAYWGAIADVSMFGGNNKAPMIMFHGTNDLVVDYECARPFSGVILVAPETCGSAVMDSALSALSMPHTLHLAPGEGHEYWGALNGEWLPLTGPNAYWQPMIQQTADYFYDLMKPAPPVITGSSSVSPSIVYTYNISNTLPSGSYCWEVTGGTIVSPNTTGPSIEVLWYNQMTQGEVRARRIDAAGVASDAGIRAVSMTASGVETLSEDQAVLQLNLFPVPARQQLNVELINAPAGEYNMELVDMLGRTVYRQSALFAPGNETHPIPTAGMPSGCYFVRLSNGTVQLFQLVEVLGY